MATLRKLVFVSAFFFLGFNFLALILGRVSLVLRISASTKTDFMNIPSIAQPFQIYPSGPIKSTSLSITDSDGNSEKLNHWGPFYRFRSDLDHFSLEFRSPVKQGFLELRLWYPPVGYFVLFQRCVFFLVLLCASVFSYLNQALKATLPANVICLVYAGYRLQFVKSSPLCDAFAMSFFWAGYLYLVLEQAKAVCGGAPWIHATMHAITVGTSVGLFIGMCEPSVAGFMAVIWLFVPGISAYLFQLGKVAVHPALLAVHFGFFVVVSAAVYFSALSRGYWAPSAACLWSETVDLSALAVFAVFQILYLIGDSVGGSPPDASLGRLTRRGQIDNLLNTLAAREEEELKAGAAFV
jgi:hypothetical protein